MPHRVAWHLLCALGLAGPGGARPTPISDRQYFHSVYFREPSGVLFELATARRRLRRRRAVSLHQPRAA